ncbi:MAG: SDR family NAD(P)-dependent oxidoreductase, partial [Microcystaceae cyanobacterium]
MKDGLRTIDNITILGENKMDLQLQDKRALVTGSTSGIGEAIAKALAAEGVHVVIQGRREAEAERVVKEIEATGGSAAIALGDLSIDEEAEQAAKQALAAFSGIDILVNNAGAFPETPWLEAGATDWVKLYDQNVGSMVRLINQMVPGMKERGWGRVIAIASGEATMPIATHAAYAATKSANLNLSVSLAKALTGTGITSNAVSPGLTLTPGVLKMLQGMAPSMGWSTDPVELEQQAAKDFAPNPSGRLAQPQDIAALVTFLASPRAAYVNGTNVRVDG